MVHSKLWFAGELITRSEKVHEDMYPVDTPDFTFSIVGLESSKQDMELKFSGVFGRGAPVEKGEFIVLGIKYSRLNSVSNIVSSASTHVSTGRRVIIVNTEEVAPVGEQSSPAAPKTAKQLAAKWNQERDAIKSRFRGNDESKKMHRNVLKHQFENFTTTPNESLDKAYDRFQKLIRQLEVYAALNLTFLSSENTSSINEVSPASGNFGVNTARGTSSSSQVSSTPGADEVVCSFFAQQTINPPLDNEDLHQIDQDDLNQGKRSDGDNGRRNATTNKPSSQALVAQDGLGGYDWSNDFDEPINYALMAISSSSLSSSFDN
ncbi:hypothetical protein Tco_0785144 [Tanacetum coccineum]